MQIELLRFAGCRALSMRFARRPLVSSRFAIFVGDGVIAVWRASGERRAAGGYYFRLAATFGKCAVTSRSSTAMASPRHAHRRQRPTCQNIAPTSLHSTTYFIFGECTISIVSRHTRCFESAAGGPSVNYITI